MRPSRSYGAANRPARVVARPGVLPLAKAPVLALGALAAGRLLRSSAQPLLILVTLGTVAAVIWDCALIQRLTS